MMNDDRRLIEDYLPIQAISAEASREKSVRKGHISTLHLWWARRPLVACRAAVYGALVPASRFVLENGPDNKKQSLGRANAAKFLAELCKYPGNPSKIAEAQRHILEAHAERLTRETGKPVTVEDIVTGRAPRPKVLDMFAGGGAIPLEALRLGCEAYALDLNPVAHVIELCTLVYPQKYGKPDTAARGCLPAATRGIAAQAGAKDGTWAGLAEEVRHWGEWVLKKVKAEIGDLYPLIPDSEFKGRRGEKDARLFATEGDEVPRGYLVPVAYLWTRTVTCKNPGCKATVPLLRQTWLCRKDGHYVALKIVAPKKERRVRFEVVEAQSAAGLGFDPEAGSKGGNATCPFCGAVADIDYVKDEGWQGRMGREFMAIVCTRPGARGKVYISPNDSREAGPEDDEIGRRINALCQRTGLTVPRAPIANLPPDCRENSLGITVRPYGLRNWGDLFTPRQMLCLLTFAAAVREAEQEMRQANLDRERLEATVTSLGLLLDRLAVYSSTQCVWHYQKGERTAKTFGRQAVPMTWDFSESSPFNEENASWPIALEWLVPGLDGVHVGRPGVLVRGSATCLPWPDSSFDAVVTDPPYYDNVPYADISDFFYVWLKRAVGHLYAEHFAGEGTPKKAEAVADATRHGGSKEKARRAYEEMMAQAFREAHRVLKPGGQMVVVYAHKTTLGWATLVDALRGAGVTVTEAWPVDTEMRSRLRGRDSSALASSIFLVARKREASERGEYETDVRPELERIVCERVATLWDMGVSGADLVIACVGAGLRAFTRFARVEYANGEEVPAEQYLGEVEVAVLDQILARLSREVGGNGGRHSLAGVDPATRFYTLWRYTYRTADLDAGEAIVFANGTHVELDGPGGLSSGPRPLVEKKKGKYRLRDYSERGEDEKLGLPRENGEPAPLVDALHRTLWLMERRPGKLAEFLREAQPNREQMRLVAQALAGPALKGGELSDVSPSGELAALAKLTANWRSVVEEAAMTPEERDERRTGQKQLDFGLPAAPDEGAAQAGKEGRR